MKRGMNNNDMQKANRCLVMKLLLERGSMTRTELSAQTGLRKATITNIVNEFLGMGILAVDGDAASGRRGEFLCLCLEGIYVLSIGINRKDYHMCLYTLDGKAVIHLQSQLSINEDIHKTLKRLEDDAAKILNKVGRKHIIGISLGMPGPYIRHQQNQEIALVSRFEQLSTVNVHKELEDALELPVLSEHDAKLSAYAEWKNSEEVKRNQNVSLIAMGSRGFGIGAGIVINGHIVRGQLGVAGEIGHMGINFNEPRTSKESLGTYEYCAGTESAVRYMLERLYEFPDSPLTENSAYQDILDAYKVSDPLATYAMEKMGWMLGFGIANAIYILNPDIIILEQDYPNWTPFLKKVQVAVRQFVHPYILESVSIRSSSLSEDSILLGGYYFVIEQLLKNNTLLDQIRLAAV